MHHMCRLGDDGTFQWAKHAERTRPARSYLPSGTITTTVHRAGLTVWRSHDDGTEHKQQIVERVREEEALPHR